MNPDTGEPTVVNHAEEDDSAPLPIKDLIELHRPPAPDEELVRSWCRHINAHLRAHKLAPMDMPYGAPPDGVLKEVIARFKAAGYIVRRKLKRNNKDEMTFLPLDPVDAEHLRSDEQ